MENLLLILSVISFHLPLAFYKDTIRRLERMSKYNPSKAMSYEDENGSLVQSNAIFYMISSLVLALIPIIWGFDLNWILAIILNTLASFFVVPFIAFAFYPTNAIYSIKSINTIGIVCVILGFILYTIAIS